VNCDFPAPVVNRIQVGHRIVNAIMGALSQALPERIPAASYGVTYIYALEAILDSGGRKIFFDFEVGGWGGEPARDGANGFSWGLHNVANVPIEVHEIDSPVTFVRSAFLPDSGGAGKHRGGLGLVREWRLDAPVGTLSATMNRARSQPYGLFGGEPGSFGRLTLIRKDGETIQLRGRIDRLVLKQGDRIRLETSGGGGFGAPSDRDPEAVRHDIRNGYVSPAAAREIYGVEVAA
jgi:N-methylhydantoinase B